MTGLNLRTGPVCALAAGMFVACGAADLLSDRLWEHACCDSIPLNGAWEMAYQPYDWESSYVPEFRGALVEKAVPGYWEDMVDAFRAAGIRDEFRINPYYRELVYPISGYSEDTTLPNIRGCFFYRRKVKLDVDGPVYLAFEGVRNQVRLWVNGDYVAFRAGFSTPFELEIPAKALVKGENELVLAVSNDPNLGYCGAEVCGLTTRALFGATGGINGNLELRIPKNDLGDVHVTTAADLRSFTVHVTGTEPYGYRILDGDRTMAEGAGRGSFTLPSKGFGFWTPESPKRYRLRLTTRDGTVEQLFGLRRLTADGERLRLNCEFVYLRGVTEHCYFPKTIHLPRDLEYYRMITRRRKELGFNFVRFHTFVPPVEYLEATDELGMLVHIETPNFVAEPEFAAIIAFARRHPSVVIYCTGNETRIDRLAETYLEDVAALVHAGTDSLFSPMSALRGLEYYLMPGRDVIADRPFEHNPERLGRVARYCDLFNSYQLSATSYDALNGAPAADVDAWGDAYCGRPRLSHEICIDGSYADLSLEDLYPADSPMRKVGMFSGIRRQLAEHGLLDRADVYFRNSCEWMRRIRKFTFEKMRSSKRTAGYDFLGDINTHWHTCGYSVGMMDEFYRLKPGETVENVLRYNSPAVVLCDLGSDFNVVAGERRRIGFSVSNYAKPAANAKFRAWLVTADGRPVCGADRPQPVAAPFGEVSELPAVDFAIPAAGAPAKYLLRAELDLDGTVAANEWELYAFPRVEPRPAPASVKTVSDCTLDELAADMRAGRRVLLTGRGPFRALDATFNIGRAGRCHGDYATVIKTDHPALAGFPHEGFCGWQFRRMMQNASVVQLEAGVPFDPIIDVASSVKFVIRQSFLFEYRVGEGRLLVCSFVLDDADPAAAWLKDRLIAYAASDGFAPRQSITQEQLRAVVEAPLRSGAIDPNRAKNPNDPSSAVRADALAQP